MEKCCMASHCYISMWGLSPLLGLSVPSKTVTLILSHLVTTQWSLSFQVEERVSCLFL